MENPKLTTNSVKSKLEKKHKHKKIDVSKNTDKNLKKQITLVQVFQIFYLLRI